jgi:hypothetical protein
LSDCVKAGLPVGKRAKLRSLVLTLLLGFAILGIGILAAMISRHC